MHIYILVLTVPRGLHQMGISAIDISSVMLEIKKIEEPKLILTLKS